MKLQPFEEELLHGWEEVYNRGQLTLWILLALKDEAKYMAEIQQFIREATEHVLSVEEQSIYRALRRYHTAGMVGYTEEPSENGPDKKVYALTATGRKVLEAFIERNIQRMFYNPKNRLLIGKK